MLAGEGQSSVEGDMQELQIAIVAVVAVICKGAVCTGSGC